MQKVFEDISTSLNLWLSVDDCGASLPTENIIPLLYNMIDLMSVKVSFSCYLAGLVFEWHT